MVCTVMKLSTVVFAQAENTYDFVAVFSRVIVD